LLCTVASTWPSMTSTSQSEISTPLSLMLTPMNNLLPGASLPDADAAAPARAGAGTIASVNVGAAGGDTSRATATP